MRRGRNRVEIEPIDRAEDWSCDRAGEKKGVGKGKGRISSCLAQVQAAADASSATLGTAVWRALHAFLCCCRPKGLCCSASQLYQQVFILHLFS